MIGFSKKSASLLIMLTMVLTMVITFSCSSDDPEQPASPIVSCQIGGACIANVYTLEQCMAMTAGTIVPSCGGSSSSLGGGNDVKVPCEIAAGVCIVNVYTVLECLEIGTIVGSCSATPSSSATSSQSTGNSSSDKAPTSSSSGGSSSSASIAGDMNCLVSGYCYEISDAVECNEYGGTPSPCEKMAGCGSYCKWDTGCFEIVPDPAAVYGKYVISTCSAAQSNCSSYGLGGPYSNSNCTNNPSSSSKPSSSSSLAPSSSSLAPSSSSLAPSSSSLAPSSSSLAPSSSSSAPRSSSSSAPRSSSSSLSLPANAKYCHLGYYCYVIGIYNGNRYYFQTEYDCRYGENGSGTVVERSWCVTNGYMILPN